MVIAISRYCFHIQWKRNTPDSSRVFNMFGLGANFWPQSQTITFLANTLSFGCLYPIAIHRIRISCTNARFQDSQDQFKAFTRSTHSIKLLQKAHTFYKKKNKNAAFTVLTVNISIFMDNSFTVIEQQFFCIKS